MNRTRHIAYSLAIGTAMITSGCAQLASPQIAKNQATNAKLAEETARIAAPAGWAYDAGADGQIAADWTAIIADPTCIDLITQALANNRSLAASAENIARAEALLLQSRAPRLPAISAGLGTSTSRNVDTGTSSEAYSGSVSASWEADVWGRVRAGALSARYSLAAAKADYASARQSLVAQVARNYVAAIETRLQLELATSTVAALEETLRIVNTRYRRGFASKADVFLAEADLASARSTQAGAASTARDATRALETVMGRYASGTLVTPLTFPNVAPVVPAGTPADVLRRRPDIVSAEYDVRAAFAGLDAAKASRWPVLSLSAGLSSSATDVADLIDPVSMATSLGASLADALFDGGLTRGRIDAAQASGQQALAAYGQAVLAAFAEVEGSLDGVDTLSARRANLTEAANASRETLRLAEIQYEEGAIDLLDVLTFRQRSFSADRTLLSVQRAEIEARIALYLALGGAQPGEGADTGANE